MYDVNTVEIGKRLELLGRMTDVLHQLDPLDDGSESVSLRQLALERSLHIILEAVTDVGNFLIDGFMMREAASYEDMITVIQAENVIDDHTARVLVELVRLRKPLVLDFTGLSVSRLSEINPELREVLPQFSDQIRHYLDRELF